MKTKVVSKEYVRKVVRSLVKDVHMMDKAWEKRGMTPEDMELFSNARRKVVGAIDLLSYGYNI